MMTKKKKKKTAAPPNQTTTQGTAYVNRVELKNMLHLGGLRQTYVLAAMIIGICIVAIPLLCLIIVKNPYNNLRDFWTYFFSSGSS